MNRSIPLKLVAAIVTGLLVLGGTFYGGMAFENHRIKSAFETAFSGLGDDSADSSSSSNDSKDVAAKDVELVEGQPLKVATEDDGEFTVTLLDSSTGEPSGTYEGAGMTRSLNYSLKIENTGKTTVSPSVDAHFEGDSGQILDFSGVFCEDNDLPDKELKPGQFVQGCKSDDLPAESGHLLFDGNVTPFFIKVDAS